MKEKTGYEEIEEKLAAAGIAYNRVMLLGYGQIAIEVDLAGVLIYKNLLMLANMFSEHIAHGGLRINAIPNREAIKLQWSDDFDKEKSTLGGLGTINF